MGALLDLPGHDRGADQGADQGADDGERGGDAFFEDEDGEGEIMRKSGIPGADTSFNRDAVRDTPAGFGGRKVPGTPPLVVDKVSSKIGIGDPAPPSPLEGVHDCAIIERAKGGTTLRYVVVAVGGYDRGPDSPTYDGFVQIMDGAIATVHP